MIDDHTFKLKLTEPYYPTIQELAVVRPVRFLGEAGFPEDGDTSKGVENRLVRAHGYWKSIKLMNMRF